MSDEISLKIPEHTGEYKILPDVRPPKVPDSMCAVMRVTIEVDYCMIIFLDIEEKG